MAISLTPEQQAQLTACVGRGHYESVEEAARQLIDERLAELALEDTDDLAWAKPHVDEALDDVAKGNLVSHEDYRARVQRRLASPDG
jgi:antitoxin ParD1/3/4